MSKNEAPISGENVVTIKPPSAFDDICSLSTFSRIDDMKKHMENDVFIFPEIALSGQITLFYGKPNTGKTVFFIKFLTDAVRQELIKGSDVIYINADDSYKGLVHKSDIVKPYGILMLSPSESGKSPQVILSLLEQMANEGEAKGKVIILDTLKKFSDMMNKGALSDFFAILRRVTAKGGTVIIAGHANKHLVDDKLVYEGTSDVLNDVDCAYAMYRMTEKDVEAQVVEFRCEKDRGDVVAKVTYGYRKPLDNSGTYTDMLHSVTRMDEGAASQANNQASEKQLLDKYEAEALFITQVSGFKAHKKTPITH